MFEVRAHLSSASRHVSLDDTTRQGQGSLEELAAKRCSLHLRHGWRPDPWTRRSGSEWDGDPHRQATAVHGLRWSSPAILVANVSRRRNEQRTVPARSPVPGYAQDTPLD